MKIFAGFAAFLIPWFVFANVIIKEIAWMGTEVSTADEWIELYNDGNEAVNLDGWTLIAEDSQPNITLSGMISAGGYFLLERTDDETMPGIAADFIYTGALGNSGEKLELKNAAGTIIDRVDATGGWPAGDNTTKETMQRTSVGGWITAVMTPASPNANQGGSQAPTSDVFPESAGADSSSTSDVGANSGVTIQPAVIQEPKKPFTVDAGDDITTIAGAEVHFSGAAFGFDGKLLDETSGNARYLWNFGDGTFFEGKNTNHIYRYPGAYRAALYVSSGETSGSNVIAVMVGENETHINEVATDWIELFNAGNLSVNISQWQIRNEAGNMFSFPAHTIIGPKAFIVFSRGTTNLLFGPVNPKAELRYANGVVADTLSFAGMVQPDKSVSRDEEGNAMMGEQTPGRENMNHESRIMNQGGKEKSNIQQAMSIAKQEKKQAMIHDSNFMIQPEESQKTELPKKTQITRASLIDSNYFWLAVSISMGLIAGAVVLLLRTMVLF